MLHLSPALKMFVVNQYWQILLHQRPSESFCQENTRNSSRSISLHLEIFKSQDDFMILGEINFLSPRNRFKTDQDNVTVPKKHQLEFLQVPRDYIHSFYNMYVCLFLNLCGVGVCMIHSFCIRGTIIKCICK